MSDRTDTRWGDLHGHPGCYGCQVCYVGLIDNVELQGPEIDGLMALRRAVRGLAGLDDAMLTCVTPLAMARVLYLRGWFLVGTQPFPGDPTRVAFHIYEHDTALGTVRGYTPSVMVPMDKKAGDYSRRVREWAEGVATRHGNVATAEVLAEALL